MIQIDAAHLWGIADFTVTEGTIVASTGNCAWRERAAEIGEFVLIVQEDVRSEALVMHTKCLPSEFASARRFVSGLAQIAPN